MSSASAAASTTRQWAHLRPSYHCSAQKRSYKDVAFMWARKNPEAARVALQIPPPSNKSSFKRDSINSLEDYYKYRNWGFSSIFTDKNERKWAQRLVSHVLSAPLTFAQHFPHQPTQHVCVVGARAEATLPVHYWNEILMNNDENIPVSWTLDFCGPEVLATSSNVTLKSINGSSIVLRWTHSGYLHEMSDPPEWNGFVLYNPGLGHDHLREGWMPTIEYLLSTQKPLLLTAHSKLDAERDARLLQDITGNSIDYQPNAFASRITYEDPYDNTHLVSPNSFVTTIIS